MNIQQVREYVHKHPSKAFTLQIADGRSIQVKHSDYITVPEKGRTIVVSYDYDKFDILDVMMVMGITGAAEPTTEQAA
ncbi:MAG: hypothetical protein L0Z50_24045 [Verrucomicrobiales bacterium]|nr:hypothetical protein [Verrucomicrobiales bacterium]